MKDSYDKSHGNNDGINSTFPPFKSVLTINKKSATYRKKRTQPTRRKKSLYK